MKYIIEIPDEVKWGVVTCRTEDEFYTRDFDSLEELNSDYINEHFGDLQDDAYERGHGIGYQKGFEDGKAVNDKGCEGCKYEGKTSGQEPCFRCARNVNDYWTAKQTDDEIKVGDEVETKDGKRFVVTTFGSGYGGDIAVGVCADGFGLGVDLEELHKTGRHFDIASILKEMQS